jgi:hypothetical protein
MLLTGWVAADPAPNPYNQTESGNYQHFNPKPQGNLFSSFQLTDFKSDLP